MSSIVKIGSAEISAIANATEDVEKVRVAIRNIMPSGLRDKAIFIQETTTGYHGNPITTLRTAFTERSDVENLIGQIASRISSLDRANLTDYLSQYVDEDGNLYLRFDKQAAYLTELHMRQEDAIRIKVRFYGSRHKPEVMRKIFKEIGLIS